MRKAMLVVSQSLLQQLNTKDATSFKYLQITFPKSMTF